MTRIVENEKARHVEWWNNYFRREPPNRKGDYRTRPLDLCHEKGYVGDPEDNIFGGINGKVRSSILRADGGELTVKDGIAKMGALHSSSALGLNVFQHWLEATSADEREPLRRALGLSHPIVQITFEEKFPTGVRGNAPNLDVALWLADESIVAIESKYLEPFSAHTHGLKDAYFVDDGFAAERWVNAGLPAHQELANTLRDKTSSVASHATLQFKHLHAEQLLKHGLGLACSLAEAPKRIGQATFRPTQLIYLYFDPTPVAVTPRQAEQDLAATARHMNEVGLYAETVSEDSPTLRFRGLTHQDLFRNLKVECQGNQDHAAYIHYLGMRYFPDSQPETT